MKVFLLLSILFVSCHGTSKRALLTDSEPGGLPIPTDSTVLYYGLSKGYPDTTRISGPDRRTVRLSKLYFDFEEPILHDYHGEREIYRFGWFRSFHRWYIFRVEKQKAKYVLTVKSSGNDFEKLKEVKKKALSLAEWNRLGMLLDSASFWNLNGFKPSEDMDGSDWIFEGYKNGNYKAVVRPGVDDLSDRYLFHFGGYIIKLAELKDERQEDVY